MTFASDVIDPLLTDNGLGESLVGKARCALCRSLSADNRCKLSVPNNWKTCPKINLGNEIDGSDGILNEGLPLLHRTMSL